MSDEIIEILDEIEIIPDIVSLGSQGASVAIRVAVTAPASVAGLLVAPDSSTRELKFIGDPGDSDWFAEHPFAPDDPIGLWLLRIRVGDLDGEMEFEVQWDQPRAPIRIAGFDAQPRSIEEGQTVTATGRVEMRIDDDRWVPLMRQLVHLAFRPDDDEDSQYLGRAVTDRRGRFEVNVAPDRSGWLRPELNVGARPPEHDEDEVALLRRADGQVHIQVARAAISATCSTPSVSKVKPLRFKHRVLVRVKGVPAVDGVIKIFYGNSSSPSSFGKQAPAQSAPDGNGWFTAYTSYRNGYRWRAKYEGPSSSGWSGWSSVKH